MNMDYCCMKNLWNAGFSMCCPIIYGWRFFAYPIIKFIKSPCKRRSRCQISIEEQLRENQSQLGGYRAGSGHYANVWTRDSFFALFAPNSIEQKRLLANRLQNNMKGYAIPFTFNEVRYVPALLCGLGCKKKNIEPSFFDEKLGQRVMDANSQYIILVHDVWKHLLERRESNMALKWLVKHERSLYRAIIFYDRFRDPLIQELPFANWEDSLLLHGIVPYTNILWLEASKRFGEMKGRLEIPQYKLDYEAREKLVFDFLATFNNLDTVTVSLLTLWFGEKIECRNHLHRLCRNYTSIEWGVPNRSKLLSSKEVFLPLRVIGQGKYHNGWFWSWVAMLWCLALLEAHFIQEAKRVYQMFERVVERDGTIYEVYDKSGRPIEKALYSSEPRFSEGMGLFLMCKEKIRLLERKK